MKRASKIIAVAIAVLMVFAVSATAFAATVTTNEEENLISSGTTYAIPKDIVVFNTSGDSIFEPNITYTYTVAPVDVGQSVKDKNSHTANIKKGVEGGLLLSSDVTTTPAATAQLQFGASDTTAATATNTEGTAISADSKKITRNLTANVVISKFGTMPGIYRYKISESSEGYQASGVTKGAYSDDRYVDVYVKWNSDGTALEVYGMTMFKADDSIEYASTPDAGFKVTGYDVATEAGDIDTYHTYNVTLTKQVAGALADKNNEFPFYVGIASGAATAAEFYATGKYANTHIVFTSGSYELNPGYATGTKTLALKAGENVIFRGLPVTAALTVAEYDNTVDTYTAAATSNGSGLDLTNNATARTWTTDAGAITSGTTPAANEVIVTNTLNEVSPTGIVTRFAPYVLMIAAAVVLLIVAKKSKKARAR